jgi:hypothetical protein
MNAEMRRRHFFMSTLIHAKQLSASFFLLCLLSACGGTTPVLPTPSLEAITPPESLLPTFQVISTPTIPCENGLTFKDDLTIPDNSIVAPGSTLDKQWLVQNSGSCNWDSHYHLRLIYGNGLGASPEQALFPARAGLTALIRIIFNAPAEPGEYFSEWQAFNDQGIPFGESFLIKIVVQ